MIVCVCHRVSDRDIARCARAGMDFNGIQSTLGVATQCGRCAGCAREVIEQCRSTAPVAAIRADWLPASPSPEQAGPWQHSQHS